MGQNAFAKGVGKMQKWIIMALLMSVSQVTTARVYMCVDQKSGEAYFTDKGCETAGTREEVRVDPANLDSGSRYTKAGKRKVWNSQEDERKSGLDYNAERREVSSSGIAGNP
mgnify:CR=1 FL=1